VAERGGPAASLEALAELVGAPTSVELEAALAPCARALAGASGATVVRADEGARRLLDEEWLRPEPSGTQEDLLRGIAGLEVVPDVELDPRTAGRFRAERVRALVALPLVGAAPYELLLAAWDEPGSPSARDLRALEHLGRMLAATQRRLRATADLEERREAERALREQDRYRTEFLATLSHELRNPLAPMKGAVQLLAAGVPEEQARLLIDILASQVRQLVRLADDLSDVGRAYQGKLRLQRALIDLRDVLATAIETSRPQLQLGGHALHWRCPEEPLLVEADGSRLVQLVANLLINAAKYTPSGGNVALEASLAGDELRVAVKDDGIGLTAEELEHVFELYEQVERGRDMALGGLGIGLSLARAIAELHGGSLVGESPGPGRGSTFTLRLPRLAAPEGAPRAPVAALFEPLPARHVLVVDDSPTAATMLRMLLERLGQLVWVAGSAEEGLELLAAFPFDVVFADIEMPGIGGLELARRVRLGSPAARPIPLLVALSGHAGNDHLRECRAAGFDDALQKPIDVADLRGLLERAGAPGA